MGNVADHAPEAYTIRTCGLADLEELLDLRMEVLACVFEDEYRATDKALFTTLREQNKAYYQIHLADESHIACVATDSAGDEVLGTGGLCLYQEMPSPDNINGRCGYLMNIYTRKAARGQGVARSLVEYLLEQARVRQVGKIYLETTPMARPLYESLGFVDMHDYLRLP